MTGQRSAEAWFSPGTYGTERFRDDIPERVLRLGELLRRYRPDAVVNLGVGNTTVWLAYALGPDIKKEVSRAGSMGEVAGALNRESEPIIVMGDGELEMDLSLLLEAVYQNAGATIFILNNGRLGMVTEKQQAEFDEILTPKRRPIRYDALEQGITGLRSMTVDETTSLDTAFRAAMSYDGTTVVEVPVEDHLSPELFSLERLPRLQ